MARGTAKKGARDAGQGRARARGRARQGRRAAAVNQGSSHGLELGKGPGGDALKLGMIEDLAQGVGRDRTAAAHGRERKACSGVKDFGDPQHTRGPEIG